MVNAAKAVALFSLLLLSSWLPGSHCFQKPVTVAREERIPFIECQVCQKLASQLHDQVQKKQAEISPRKITEYEITKIAKNLCNSKKSEADWILKIDIVEKGKRLELVDQDTEGICNSDCKTLEKACQEVMGYSYTKVADCLNQPEHQGVSLIDCLCKDLTGACSKKPLPEPAGMPGIKDLGEEDDVQNGKVFNDKGRWFRDWKQKLTGKVKTKGDALKRHVNTVSNRVGQWWRGAEKAGPKEKAKSDKEL